MSKNNNDKNSMLNKKITIITVIACVWIICLVAVLAHCEMQNKPEDVGTTNHPDVQTDTTVEEYTLPSYTTDTTGTISREESKTLAHFLSHYQDDYYRVNESQIVTKKNGEYYQTEIVAYSKDGYLYRETFMGPYEDRDFVTDSVISLVTPDSAYAIYPAMKTYFKGDGNSKGYTNEINFSDTEFDTGNININGISYYYEEVKGEDGNNYKYCFDENGELRYRIAQTESGSITERYIEYTRDFDHSIFKIPANYTEQ